MHLMHPKGPVDRGGSAFVRGSTNQDSMRESFLPA